MINVPDSVKALAFDGQGGCGAVSPDNLSNTLTGAEGFWIQLDWNDPEAHSWLTSAISFPDELVPQALLAQDTRPRLEELDTGTLIILRGVNLNADADPEDMISVRLWVFDSNVISLRRRNLKAVNDIADRLNNGKGPKNAGEFVAQLTSRLFERMEPTLENLEEHLDVLEDAVIEVPDAMDRMLIANIRKQAIVYKRYISPQRDVISGLLNLKNTFLSGKDERLLRETQDRVIRYVENLDAVRERGQIIKDELVNALSDRMNKNLYILSVIAAIFLPLGFLTGLLGINVAGIPGSNFEGAFLIFCILLVLVAVCQVIVFRFFKWF
jgi:zinc transporter